MRAARGRRLRRRLKWLLVPAAAVLVAGGIFLWTVPISWPWLMERAAREVETATGLKFSYDTARLYLGKGLLRIDNLRILRPDGGEALASARRTDIDVSPFAAITSSQHIVTGLTLLDPSGLQFQLDGHRVTPDGPTAEIVRTVLETRKNQPAGDTPLGNLRISNATIPLECLGAYSAGDDILPRPRPRTTYTFENTDLTLSVAPNRATAQFSARVVGDGTAATISGTARTANGALASADIKVDAAETSGLAPWAPDWAASIQRLRIQVDPAEKSETPARDATITAAALDLTNPLTGHRLSERDITLTARGSLETDTESSATALAVQLGTIKTSDTDADFAGRITLDRTRDFRARLEARQVGDGVADLLLQYLPQEWEITVPANSLQVSFDASGNSAGLAAATGSLRVAGVTVRTPWFASPVENLTGEVALEPNRIAIPGISASAAGGTISLKGDLAGPFLAERRGTVNFDWNLDLPGASVSRLLAGVEGARQIAVDGRITGRGTYKQELALDEPNLQAGDPDLNGSITFEQVSIRHPSLPAPLEQLSGEATATDDRVELSGLTARFNGRDVAVKGAIQGKRVFWRDPVARGSIEASVESASLFKSMPEDVQQFAVTHALRGEADIALDADWPLRDPSKWKTTGRVTVRNGTFDPAFERFAGKFTGIEGSATYDGNRLTIEKLSGVVHGETVFATAVVAPDEVRASLRGAFDLSLLTKLLPRMAPWMDLGGPADGNIEFSTAVPAATGAAAASAGPASVDHVRLLLNGLGERLATAMTTDQYRLTGRLAVGNDKAGARLRHISMPLAKTDPAGRSIPQADISNARGTVRIEGRRLTIESPATLNLADTTNCEATAFMEFRPGQHPLLDFNLRVRGEARLNSWVFGWGEELRRRREAGQIPPPPPGPARSFDLKGRIRADRATYRDQRSGPIQFTIAYGFNREQPWKFDITEATVQRDGGTINADINMTGQPGQQGRAQWRINGSAQNFEILPLMIWAFRDIRTVDGRVTGRIDVRGVGNDKNAVAGQGSASMTNLELSNVPLVSRIGQRTNVNFTGRRFETASAAQFTIRDGAVSTNELNLQSQGMGMTLRGRYTFDRQIDAMVRLSLLQSTVGAVTGAVTGAVPIIGNIASEVLKVADSAMGNLLIAFRVTGDSRNPNIQPVPLPAFTNPQ